jgi:hypothetical protein
MAILDHGRAALPPQAIRPWRAVRRVTARVILYLERSTLLVPRQKLQGLCDISATAQHRVDFPLNNLLTPDCSRALILELLFVL